MFSIKTILNPEPSRPETRSSFEPRSTMSSPGLSTITEVSSKMDRPIFPRTRTAKESNNMAKSKLRGPIKYTPFENLDEFSLRQVRDFEIEPFGSIVETCQHIPYNSGKKDFFEKTGRESFEVFRYVFKYPGHNTEYAVMWDYNVGLVRMTPFFKCCGYGKTMPAKMLGQNPGLKEITHSITGGSIAAQGYWMPYQCARAVCATFCYPIAGALIPLFGPAFPSECIPPDSPDFSRMIINPQLVRDATREAELSRRLQSTNTIPSLHNATSYPRHEPSIPRAPFVPDDRYAPFRPHLVCDPSYSNDYELENYHSIPNSASSGGSDLHSYMVASRPNSSWTPANLPRPQLDNSHQPNPWLSAVPRIAPLQPSGAPVAYALGLKRRFDYEESEYAYERTPSPNLSMSPAALGSAVASPVRDLIPAEPQLHDPAQKSAAWLLLNLSMHEQNTVTGRLSSPPVGSVGVQTPEPSTPDTHRHKRQRASSFSAVETGNHKVWE